MDTGFLYINDNEGALFNLTVQAGKRVIRIQGNAMAPGAEFYCERKDVPRRQKERCEDDEQKHLWFIFFRSFFAKEGMRYLKVCGAGKNNYSAISIVDGSRFCIVGRKPLDFFQKQFNLGHAMLLSPQSIGLSLKNLNAGILYA
jgi:hypothetical protein